MPEVDSGFSVVMGAAVGPAVPVGPSNSVVVPLPKGAETFNVGMSDRNPELAAPAALSLDAVTVMVGV